MAELLAEAWLRHVEIASTQLLTMHAYSIVSFLRIIAVLKSYICQLNRD